MTNIKFGLPTREVKPKIEKYPDLAVMTLTAAVNKSENVKITFNEKAIEALNFRKVTPDAKGDRYFAFAFDQVNNKVYVGDVTHKEDVNDKDKIRLTLAFTGSNKRNFNYICKWFKVSEKLNHEFEVKSSEAGICEIIYMVQVSCCKEEVKNEVVEEKK